MRGPAQAKQKAIFPQVVSHVSPKTGGELLALYCMTGFRDILHQGQPSDPSEN